MNIVDTDAFLEMPQTSQLFYFHLSMRADDEGFVGNPKKIMKMLGSGEDDYKVLISKRFIIPFESGVCVIKHWLMHNTIRMDRFNPTTYQMEKEQLLIKENKGYKLIIEPLNGWQPSGNHLATQVKLSKVKLSKEREENHTSISYLKEIPEKDLKEFNGRFQVTISGLKNKAESLYLYCESKGKKYKNYRALFLNVLKKDFPERRIEIIEEPIEIIPLTEKQEKAIEKKKEEIRRKFSIR